MNLRHLPGSAFGKALSCFCAFSLLYSNSAIAFNTAAINLGDAFGQILRGRPGPYTERPRTIYRGSNPKREPLTRGGMWSPAALHDAEISRYAGLVAGLDGEMFIHSTAVSAAPGEAMPWETSREGVGGGKVNTGNGNKLTEIPLVSWKDRGGMVVDFTLYNSSESTYNDELGHGWTWTYDIYINEGFDTATVHWGDGTCIPFAESGGIYTAPTGIYDTLVKNGNGTWTLTKKHGTVYNFNTSEFCTSIIDRNGNTITLTLDGSMYCTRVTGPSGRYIDISLSGSNFASITDPLSRTWSFSINGGTDRLDTVTWPTLGGNSYTDSFSYNANNRITTHTDRRGKAWVYTYNAVDGSIATEKTPLNHQTSYSYTWAATTVTYPGSQTHVYNYSSGKIASVVDQGSFSESYTWNGSNQMTQKVDRRGKTWAYTYDSDGNVLTVTNPLSKVWTYTYSGDNELLTEEDPLDNLTSYEYDANGNLETVEDPLGHLTQYTYDQYGQIETIEDALTNVTTLTFDTDGNLTAIEDPLENVTSMTYNDLGQPLTVTDANSNAETFAYDAWGRLELVTHEDDTEVQTEYNLVDQVTSVTNERGKTTTYAYDDSGRLTSTTNAESETESYAYNSNGWRTSVTNGRNKTRTYAYTSRGEVYTLTLPDSSVETWSYNGNGQVSAYMNPLSQTISYTFDNASQQTGIDYPAGTDTSFGYDDAGRRTSMVDSTGTINWTYDDCSRVTAFDPPSGLIDYTYNADHSRATMDEDGVGVTTYTFNAGGRLASIENPFSETTSFTYDDGGRLTRKDFESGQYEALTYDTRNRVTQILLKNSGNSTLRTQSWTYDDGSNVLTKTQGGVETTYDYDDIDQLTSESRSGYSASYTYDANGNRLTRTIGGTTENYTYDDADKLDYIQVNSSTVKDFSYDSAGRTTSVVVGANTTSLTYDYENRITQITYPNSSTNTFAYNGLDTRVSKVDSGGTKTYLRDGAGVTSPVINDAAASYTPGISERRSSTTTYYHGGIKNAESQTNTSQTVAATKTFDAFGNADTSSGTWKGTFAYGGPFGYQSDPDSGLMLLGHRYYDPATGRFLSRDFFHTGRNWYSYCENSGTSYADWNGLYHIMITIRKDGLGSGTVYADPGDPIGMDDSGKPFYGRGGEVVYKFPASNIVVPGHKPFPDGTWIPTGIEHGHGMGPNYIVFREDQGVASDRGTWVHSGAGANWKKPTEGCVRGTEDDVNALVDFLNLGWRFNRMRKPRVTVVHD